MVQRAPALDSVANEILHDSNIYIIREQLLHSPYACSSLHGKRRYLKMTQILCVKNFVVYNLSRFIFGETFFLTKLKI